MRNEAQTIENAENETTESRNAPATNDDVDEAAHHPEHAEGDSDAQDGASSTARRRVNWSRVVVYGVLPGLGIVLAAGAGFLKWQGASADLTAKARAEAVATAMDSAAAVLSYQADSADKDLAAAEERLTGDFKESFAQLAREVVVPGARQHRISSVAAVPAASAVSSTPDHAVVLAFVNQTVTVGTEQPSDSASSVRVTLDKIGDRWLISGFDPV